MGPLSDAVPWWWWAMKSLVCECGASLQLSAQELVARAGQPLTCPACGRTKRLPPLGLPGEQRALGLPGRAERRTSSVPVRQRQGRRAPPELLPRAVPEEPEPPAKNRGPWLVTAAALSVVAVIECVVIFGLREAKEEIVPAIEQLQYGARQTAETVKPAVDLLATPAKVGEQLEELEEGGDATK